MQLKKFLFVDEFPMRFNPKNILIITHLLHLDQRTTMPQKLPIIYTTKKLADQFKAYCDFKLYTCITKTVIVEPYIPFDISLEPSKTYHIMLCESDEINGNLMVLIKENGILDQIYAGNLIDIRTPVINDTFAEWVSPGVNTLYINLKRAHCDVANVEYVELVDKAVQETVSSLREIDDNKLHIKMPLFGYENFIYELSKRLKNRVWLSDKYMKFYKNLAVDNHSTAMDEFGTENSHRVYITDLKEVRRLSANYKTITIAHAAFEQRKDNKMPSEIYYTPEPSVLDMQTLCRLTKPYEIRGIIDVFHSNSQVPEYLIPFSRRYKEKNKATTPLQQDLNGAPTTQKPELPTTVMIGYRKDAASTKGAYLTDSGSDSI